MTPDYVYNVCSLEEIVVHSWKHYYNQLPPSLKNKDKKKNKYKNNSKKQ